MKRTFRDEFQGALLGDARRSERMVELAVALATAPAASFPEVLGDGAELEAAYRFLGNPDVDVEEILEPHASESVARCREHAVVVVAHDTTDFTYSSERQGLGRTSGLAKNGYFAHVALAVTPTETRDPLGVLHLEPWVRGEKQPRKHPRKRREDPDRESTRWLRGVAAVEERLDAGRTIHVMDREADDYDLLCTMVAEKRRFVVRCSFDRRLEGDEKLREYTAAQPVVTMRNVPLEERKKSLLPKQRKAHPPRRERAATLELKSVVISVKRPTNLPTTLPEVLPIHLVIVEEVDVPTGEPAVSWRLYTSEPITTAEDVERVVDLYRCRWTIEEFFKALKTGCAIEKRQLESYHSLLNALAIYIPIAWRALRLRCLARANGDGPATTAFTALQLRIVRLKAKRSLSASPTLTEALCAVASMGGHLKRNGDPGWLTILRGYEKLLALEEGALIAAEM